MNISLLLNVSEGGNIKQNYEVEGPYAAAAKYSEFKSNSGATGNIEFPNIQSIPIPNGANSPYTQKSQASFPHDDTKYFSRPPKQQESESMTYKNVEPFDYSYKYRVRKPQESRGPTDYHEYNVQNTPESNSYEVTERNDIKYRRPSHANENRYKYVADEEENSHAVTEPFRPITYDDSEERYSHSNYPSRQPHEETTRHGKGKDYQTGGYATQHERGSNSPKYNSYKNSNSYRADTKRLKINRERTEGLDQNVASSERNLKTNKNYSSKFAKDHLKHPSDTTSSELKYTAELEPTVSTENLVKQVPRTEINVYTNQIHSTVASDNDHSEDVFKPIIVTTPASKYKILNRQTHQAPDKVKNSNQTRNQTQSTQYVNEEDIILYQNLDEHEFKRPSPIYQPTDSESHKNSRNELTLTYVPKIKSVSNNTEISEFKR